MEEFNLETRIREIVLELSKPSLEKSTESLMMTKSLSQAMEETSGKLAKHLLLYQQTDQRLTVKMHELDSLGVRFKKWEAEGPQREFETQKEIRELKLELETMRRDVRQIGEMQKNNSMQQVKQAEDLRSSNGKLQKQVDEIHHKIQEFIQEQYNYYIDMKNNFNKINESHVYLNRDYDSHNKVIDGLSVEFQTYKTQREQFKKTLEYIQDTMEEMVPRSTLRDMLQESEHQRIKEFDGLRLQLEELRRHQNKKIEGANIRLDTIDANEIYFRKWITDLEEKILVNDATIGGKIIQLNQTLNDIQVSIGKQDEEVRARIREYNEGQSQTLLNLQAQARKESIRAHQELTIFKEQVASDIKDEITIKIKMAYSDILTEFEDRMHTYASELVDKKLEEIKELIQKPKEMKDATSQMDEFEQIKITNSLMINTQASAKQNKPPLPLSTPVNMTQSAKLQPANTTQAVVDYEHIQELIEKTLFELINEVIASSPVFKEQLDQALQKERIGLLNEVKQYLEVVLSQSDKVRAAKIIRNTSKRLDSEQSAASNTNIALIEEIRDDISILNELREETEHKFNMLRGEFNDAYAKIEKYQTQLLKIKSDFVNDNEYIHTQMKQLFKEREASHKKFSQVVALVSSAMESVYIIASIMCQREYFTLLKENEAEIHYIKFQSFIEGVIFEQKPSYSNDHSITYRGQKFAIQDLLRKTVQGSLDLWNACFDGDILPECREQLPGQFFKTQIKKEVIIQNIKEMGKDSRNSNHMTYSIENKNMTTHSATQSREPSRTMLEFNRYNDVTTYPIDSKKNASQKMKVNSLFANTVRDSKIKEKDAQMTVQKFLQLEKKKETLETSQSRQQTPQKDFPRLQNFISRKERTKSQNQ